MSKARRAACVFLAMFLFALVNGTMGPLLTKTIDHYALAESQQGLAVAMLNVGCIAALLSSLWVMGRIKKPNLLWLASAATAALMAPLAIPPPFGAYASLFLLVGVALGYTDTLSSSSIADLYAGDERKSAAMMCMLHAVFGSAGILSPIAYRALMDAGLAWNRIYWILCAFGAAALAYIAPTGARWAREAERADAARVSLAEMGRFVRDRGRALILLAIFLYGAYLSGVTVWIDRYVSVTLGRADLGALSLSLFWLGLTASRLISPLIRLRPTTLIRIACYATSAILAVGIAASNAAFLCAAGAVAGLFSGAIIPLLLHVACRQYPSNTLLATTFLFLALYSAQSVFPPMMGYIESVGGLRLAMLVCPAALFGCGLAAQFMRGEKPPRPEGAAGDS